MNQMQNLKGVREVKNYQARIYFYHIEENVSLVSLIQIKKNDFSKKEKERIVNRAQLMYDSLDDIREMLNDPIKREEFLDEGREITTRIEEKISSRKRGGK